MASLTELGFDLAAETSIRLDRRPSTEDPAGMRDPVRSTRRRHLITRDGRSRHQAFLHEAGTHSTTRVRPALPYAIPPARATTR
jgi:hypothetical protein